MQQYNLSDLRSFIKVVESGSFKLAAEQLSISTASISRRVAALEKALGVRLLHRTTRQIHLTDAGARYFNEARNALCALDEAEDCLHQELREITGSLRVAAPLSFSIRRISPILPGFLHQHPGVNIQLQVDDRETDLFAEGMDLAIRIGQLNDSSLIATRIGAIHNVFCAAPDYLTRQGEPGSLDELARHQLLHYSLLSMSQEWGFNAADFKPDTVRLSANNGEILLQAAIQGMGVAMLPDFIVEHALAAGQLRVIDKLTARPPIGLYALRPSRQYTPSRVEAFIAYLRQQFSGS